MGSDKDYGKLYDAFVAALRPSPEALDRAYSSRLVTPLLLAQRDREVSGDSGRFDTPVRPSRPSDRALGNLAVMQLIVLGMHRSGTSSVTRLLNLAGAYFGPEGIATDPNEENPKGFWERRDVRAVCDGLLHGGGYDWWRVADFSPDNIPEDVRAERLEEFRRIVFHLDAHRPWVMKEPRLCLLLPILRPVARGAGDRARDPRAARDRAVTRRPQRTAGRSRAWRCGRRTRSARSRRRPTSRA